MSQVPLGSVTPLAVCNASASGVVLFLDEKIRSQSVVFVHPLVNTSSLAMSPAALEAALAALGSRANFVDLEAEPKIDKDTPPDLASYVNSAAAGGDATASNSSAATTAIPTAAIAARPAQASSTSSKGPAARSGSSEAAAPASVPLPVDAVIAKVIVCAGVHNV